jgi:predicted dehydrogenase
MTAYRLHFEEANLEALKMAQSKLGDLRIFNSTFTMQVKDENNIRLNPTTRGGGPIWDIGIYCINAARSLFHDEPIEVFGFAENNGEERFSQTDEMINVLLRFPRNRLASFVCSFGADSCANYDLVGTKGRIHLEKAYEYASKSVLISFF